MKSKGFVPRVRHTTRIGGPDPVPKEPVVVIKDLSGKAGRTSYGLEEVTFRCPHCHGAIVLKIGKGGLGLFGL